MAANFRKAAGGRWTICCYAGEHVEGDLVLVVRRDGYRAVHRLGARIESCEAGELFEPGPITSIEGVLQNINAARRLRAVRVVHPSHVSSRELH